MQSSYIQLIGRRYSRESFTSVHVALLQSYASGNLSWWITSTVVDRGEAFRTRYRVANRSAAMRVIREYLAREG